jgi:hypothetical protein
VAADTDSGPLCPVHCYRGVPADPGAVLALDLFVTGERWFVGRGDRVQVISGGNHRNAQVQLFRAFEQAEHDFSAASVTLRRDKSIE